MSHEKHRTLIILLFLSLFVMSACGAPSDEGRPDEPGFEPIGEPLPENISFWDFQEGALPDWDHSPGWTYDDGNALSKTGEQMMFSEKQWANFQLITRLGFGPDSIFEITFRATDKGAYQIFFEPGAVILTSNFSGGVDELLVVQTTFDPGWHDIGVIVEESFIALVVDGTPIFEEALLEDTAPGSLVFMHHAGGEFAIDFVEVLDLDFGGEPSGEFEGQAGETLAGAPLAVIPWAPIAERIHFGEADDSFMVPVWGDAGAVSPGSLVSVANLQTTRVYFILANEDGSFETTIFAYPGSAIQIKHTLPEGISEPLSALLGDDLRDEVIIESQNATTGTILHVPHTPLEVVDGIAIQESGFLRPASNAYWHFDGAIEFVNRSAQDLHLQLTGKLLITSLGALQDIDFDALNPTVFALLVQHFNQEGEQSVIRKFLVSDFLTPTGFPIFHGEVPWTEISGAGMNFEWREERPNTVVADVRIDIVNERRNPIPDGVYSLRVEVAGWDPIPVPPAEGPTMRSGVMFGPGGFYSPLFNIGNPDAPQLHWGLLTDSLHEATRGTVSREARNRISLLPMISFQDETFLIPRDDPKTGQRIRYRLEPFLPLISYSDRGIPAPPTIEFAFPSGELQVNVSRPDGSSETLGPAPFVQSVNSSPAYDFGKVLDYSVGGGALHEVYQLSTRSDEFEIIFEQYGHYVIEMSGSIEDVYGNTYTGGGTYDVHVARPLKLSAGMLPSAPFVEGDVFSPSLQVFPRMPVGVEMRLTFLPDSSPARAIQRVYSGDANPYGYYFPSNHEPFVFRDGGEYRVDITAQFMDERGTLWMGSATYGNVVENKGTPLIAHGSRGIDHPEVNNLWFFHQQLEVEGVYHTFFPYYSGDVFWGHDAAGEDTTNKGADAIIPGVSFEDTQGVIGQLLTTSWYADSNAAFDVPDGQYEKAIEAGEIRPFSSTSTGYSISWFPEQVDQYGYVYASSQRPDARVHESISEGIIPIGYWRYVGTYGDQVGVEGDLPNDLKWQFGGVVFRDVPRGINEYAAYGSLWVLLPDDDPTGARVTPPFQGATGGPNGGPILTLRGEEIDLLFLPRSGFPGQILALGDTLSFSGYVGPPLESKVTIKVTSPSGQARTISGQADSIGYFYQPEADFTVDEAGFWEIELEVVHDGLTSSGPTMEPYPTGSVLGAEENTYGIYVVDPRLGMPEVRSPIPGFIQITQTPIAPIVFRGVLLPDFQDASFTYTIAMPGFILEQGKGRAEGGTYSITYDPVSLNEDFPNLDLTAYDDLRPGLADQVWISVLFQAGDRAIPQLISLRGEELFHR